MADEYTYEVVSPVGRRALNPIEQRPRHDDLAGKTVCELWDLMFRGEIIYPAIREALERSFPNMRFVDHSHFGNTHGAQQNQLLADLPDLLRRHGCDVVISGIGA